MVEAVLDALANVFPDPFHRFLAEIAADNVSAKRKRKSSAVLPPFTEIENFVKTEFPIRELAFVNEKSRLVLAFLNFVENLIERDDLVFHGRLVEAKREECRGQSSWNSDRF